MARAPSERRQRGSIRPNILGFRRASTSLGIRSRRKKIHFYEQETDRRASESQRRTAASSARSRPEGRHRAARAIKGGVMPLGAQLPVLDDLVVTYGIFHGSAHRAFAQLKREGLLEAGRALRAIVREP